MGVKNVLDITLVRQVDQFVHGSVENCFNPFVETSGILSLRFPPGQLDEGTQAPAMLNAIVD